MAPGVNFTKDLFRNVGAGWVGVVTIDSKMNTKPIGVGPGDEVWLSEEEQILTANAPRLPEDNPLINGSLELVTESEEIVHRRPLRPVAEVVDADTGETVGDGDPTPAPTGTPPTPDGPPPAGTRPPGEEVGTPEAVATAPTAPSAPEAADPATLAPAVPKATPPKPAAPKPAAPKATATA